MVNSELEEEWEEWEE